MTTSPSKIPEAAVEAAALIVYRTSGRKRVMSYDEARNVCEAEARELLEAAAPHMTGGRLMHAYAALGYTVCGLDTGGAISRHEGYEGPAHRSTIDAEHVTCDACRA